MSTLKTNHCDWDKNTRREMTLDEFVGQLPISHCARKEFKALQAKIARLKELLKAKDELLVCYRLGKRPSEKLLNKLQALNESEGMSRLDEITDDWCDEIEERIEALEKWVLGMEEGKQPAREILEEME